MLRLLCALLLASGCAPRYVQAPAPVLAVSSGLTGQTPIAIEIDPLADDLVIGEHLGGLAEVHQYDYKIKNLSTLLRQRVEEAARRFGFVPRPAPAPMTLRTGLPTFKVITRDFFAGDDVDVDIHGTMMVVDGAGRTLYNAPLEVQSHPGTDDDPSVIFRELDQALTRWFEELRASIQSRSELAAALTKAGKQGQYDVPGGQSYTLERPATMLMMGLKAVGPVREHVPALMTRLLLAALQDVRGLKTMGMDDIEMLLTVERKKDAVGCTTNTCMAEIGGALGARFVVSGELGILGSNYTVTLSVLDSQSSTVCARVSRVLPQEDDALGALLPGLVAELVSKLNQTMTASAS
jgi:hypothetical protein